MPCSAANETALRIRSSIDSRVTPSAASFASEIGDSITLAWTPSSTSASASAGDRAREAPHLGARGRRRRSARPRASRPPRRAGSPPRSARSRARRSRGRARASAAGRGRRRRSARRRGASCRRGRPSRRSRAASLSAPGPDQVAVSGNDAIRERGELLGAVRGDQEVVLEPQAAALRPVDAGSIASTMPSAISPPPAWCAYGGSWARAPMPWQIGWRRLTGVADRGEALADTPVELGQARARAGRTRPRRRRRR